MKVGILQPGYLPWLGFFEQVYKSDKFIFYDDVQFDKNSWRNRNRIKTPDGPLWLTIPVRQKGHISQTLLETEIAEKNAGPGNTSIPSRPIMQKPPILIVTLRILARFYNKSGPILLTLILLSLSIFSGNWGL